MRSEPQWQKSLEEKTLQRLNHFKLVSLVLSNHFTSSTALNSPACLPPGDICWFRSPDSERKTPSDNWETSTWELNGRTRAIPYLQFLRLPPNFEQLCDGVDKPLKVMVAQLLYLPIMVPDASIQLFHEEAMFLTIVHRPEGGKKWESTAFKKSSQCLGTAVVSF